MVAALQNVRPDEPLPLGLGRKNDWPSRPRRDKRASRAVVRFLITIGIGVAGTLAWQSYGDVAREMIANPLCRRLPTKSRRPSRLCLLPFCSSSRRCRPIWPPCGKAWTSLPPRFSRWGATSPRCRRPSRPSFARSQRLRRLRRLRRGKSLPLRATECRTEAPPRHCAFHGSHHQRAAGSFHGG